MATPPPPANPQDGSDKGGRSTSSNPVGVGEEDRSDTAKPAGGEGASSSTAVSTTPEAEPEGTQQEEEEDRDSSPHASEGGAVGAGSGEARGEPAAAVHTPEPQASSSAHAEEGEARAAPGSVADQHANGEDEEEDAEVFFSTGEDVSSSSESSGSDSSGEETDSRDDEEEEEEEDSEHTEKREGAEKTAEGEQELVHGCAHYRRKCKVVAPCCGKVFWCRHCHNEESEQDITTAHEIDRHAVEEIICAACEARQPVSNTCIECGIIFGSYFCSICKFWDDQGQRKKVYHCDECGICRAGGREKFFHCATCGSCYPKQLQNKHKCLENAMRRQCPVCLEDMFSSLRQSQVLMCGHTIHSDCLRQLQRQGGMQSLRCPMCCKSIADFSEYWRIMREEIRHTPLDAQFQKKVRIVCNDCLERCVTDFHFVGLMCTKCNGFNTRTVEEC
ncbi:hypothetical protein Esti_004687 [Eimeria stiedai]